MCTSSYPFVSLLVLGRIQYLHKAMNYAMLGSSLGGYVIVSAEDRERLQAVIAGDRNRPRKHVERAGIVLASADRGPAQRVA
jgi:hypothetical protein